MGASLTLLGGTAALRYAAVHNAAGAFASATYFAGAALMAGAAFGLWTFKPWRSSRGGKILERDWVRLVVAALCLAAGTFVSLYCLRVIGSLRAFLLDYVDIAAVVAVGALLAPSRKPLPTRALLIAIHTHGGATTVRSLVRRWARTGATGTATHGAARVAAPPAAGAHGMVRGRQ